MTRWAAIALVAALPAAAQEAELRPAPDWFVDTVVAVTTAEQIARVCGSLGLEGEVLGAITAEVIARLDAEGFDTSRSDGGMTPTAEAFTARQQEFLEKHALTGVVTEDMVCAAGRAEMAEGSEIGSYLTEQPG